MVKTYIDRDQVWTNSGTITLDPPNAKTIKSAQNVYLPPGNMVFTLPPPIQNRKILAGPQIEAEQRTGTFVSSDHSIRRQVIMSLKPSGPDIMVGGVIDGRVDMNLLDVRWYGAK